MDRRRSSGRSRRSQGIFQRAKDLSSARVPTCPGSLISHVGGIVAGCTLDELDDDGGCLGLELRHEGEPMLCWRAFGGCDVCGIHQTP